MIHLERLDIQALLVVALPIIQKREKKWLWSDTVAPLTMHFMAWAPGFKPLIYSINNVNPKDEFNLTLSLERLPDGAQIEEQFRDFENLLNVVSRHMHYGRLTYKLKIDKSLLRTITQTLEEWIQDETLSGYIRWNAYDVLKSIYRKIVSEKDIAEEVKTVLDRVEEKAKSLTPYLADSPSNPWSFKERYENLFFTSFVRLEAGKVYSEYRHKDLEITPESVEEVSDLLLKGEAIDPNNPELDNLRAVITLAKQERERALSLSHYLDHYHFFKLFYGLGVIMPQY